MYGLLMDLDQSSLYKASQRVYLGPSLGWIDVPGYATIVNTTGTSIISLGITLVRVFFNGAGVVIKLPSAFGFTQLPGTLAAQVITVCDIGGFAGANPITIQGTGSEQIDGLASIQITSNYGAFNLKPNITQGGYTIQ